MGFWSGLGKIVQGKPVFEESDASSGSGWADKDDHPVVRPDDAQELSEELSHKTPVGENGYKIIPIVKLEHCKSHINGDTLEATIWATNTSQEEIELDTIVIADVTTHLDKRRLAAGQGHEIRIYSGLALRHENHQAASLYYRLVRSDDNFRADFRVEYSYQSDGTYHISDLHPEHDVHDI